MTTIEELEAMRARVHCLEELMSVRDVVVAEQSAALRADRDSLAVAEEKARRGLEELEATQQHLMEASRHAGMAEVATGVLHDVGNVLNSVSVSASLIDRRVRGSRSTDLLKVTALLRANEQDLGAYIALDQRGKLLPTFLTSLAEHLVADQAELAKELVALTKSVDHIKQIVAAHQSYVRPSSMAEIVDPVDLMEDALRIGAGDLLQYDVRVERNYAASRPINVDKHKLLQIMVNLVKNARASLVASQRQPRTLRLTVDRHADDGSMLIFQVTDNGVGIAPENMARLFEHGFTTKPSGNGFGLHGAALAARALGGLLRAHSDGQATGATFTVDVPFRLEGGVAR